MRLADSRVAVHETTTNFYAASDVIILEDSDDDNINAHDDLTYHKAKFLKIGKESEWLLNEGMSVDWNFDFQTKYKRLLREKDIVTIQGVADYDLITDRFNDYWGEDFLKTLYSAMDDTRDWIRQLYAARIVTFKPIYHILLMCFLKGSVKAFLESDPSENPFGKGPWPCENPICGHCGTDGCKNTEIRYLNGVATGFFQCDRCGMLYKQVKRKGKTGNRLIVNYGHVWTGEMSRCLIDKKMNVAETAGILKCTPHVVESHMKKLGLRVEKKYFRSPQPIGWKSETAEFHKERVLKIYEQYQEVTFSMLRKHAPGTYAYLSKHDPAWLREHLIHESRRADSREADRQLLKQIQAAVEWIQNEGNKERQLTFGYIARVAGEKEQELKYSKLKRPLTKTYLDAVVESREEWLRRRITAIRRNKDGCEPVSIADIKREMSLKPNTYRRYHDFIKRLIDELNK
jgi:uncharacterized C2H2 Zn-finger protein